MATEHSYVHSLRERLASLLGGLVVGGSGGSDDSTSNPLPRSRAAATFGWDRVNETALCDALRVETFEGAQDVMNALAVSEAAYAAHELGPHAAAAAASSVARAAAAARSNGGNSSSRGLVGIASLQPSLPHVRHRYVLALTEDCKTLVVGFAGTTDARDLWADVNLLQDELPGFGASDKDDGDAPSTSSSVSRPAAHRGFLERASAVPIEQLAEHAATDLPGCERMLLCGHSLGGAVAQLAALRLLLLRDRELKEKSGNGRRMMHHLPVSCVAFAPPALGNAALATLVERKGWRPLFYSLTFADDPVPRMLADIDASLKRGGGAESSAVADAAGVIEEATASATTTTSSSSNAAAAVVCHTPLTEKGDSNSSSPTWTSVLPGGSTATTTTNSTAAATAAAAAAASAVAGAVAGAARSAAAAAAARLPAVPSYAHLGTHHSPEIGVEEREKGENVREEAQKEAAAVAAASSPPRDEETKKKIETTTAAAAVASRLAALAAAALPAGLPSAATTTMNSFAGALPSLPALPSFSLRVPSLAPHRLSTYRERLLSISARAWESSGSRNLDLSSSTAAAAAPVVRLVTTIAPPLVAAEASARMPLLPPTLLQGLGRNSSGGSKKANNSSSSSSRPFPNASALSGEAASPASYWAAVRRGAARAAAAAAPATSTTATVAKTGTAAAAAAAAASAVVALRIAVRGSGLSSVRGARLQALGSWCQATALHSPSTSTLASSSSTLPSSQLDVVARLPLATAREAASATGLPRRISSRSDGESSSSSSSSSSPLTLWLRSDFREAALPVSLRLPSVWLLGFPPGAEHAAVAAISSSPSGAARRDSSGSGLVVSSDGIAVVPAAVAAQQAQASNESSKEQPPLVPLREQVAAACASLERESENGERQGNKRGVSFTSAVARWWRRLGSLSASSSSSFSSSFPPPDALVVVHGSPFSSSRHRRGERAALARLTEAAARRGVRVVPVVACLEDDKEGEYKSTTKMTASSGHNALAALSEVEESYRGALGASSNETLSFSAVALPPVALPSSLPSSSSLLSSIFRRELLRREIGQGESPSSRL